MTERVAPLFTDILILGLLRRGPRHGYEIKQAVEATLGGLYQMNNSQLYPALATFQEMGAITREVVQQQGRPDKHLYHLTSLGSEILHDLVVDFPPDRARREAEFYVRVAYFDLLLPAERLAILRQRLDILHRRLQNVASWRAGGADGYMSGLVGMRTAMLDLERRQVEAWIGRESETAE